MLGELACALLIDKQACSDKPIRYLSTRVDIEYGIALLDLCALTEQSGSCDN